MFKINLRLFLLFIVAGNVSSLKCNQMDVSACNRDGNLTTLAVCLKSHIKSVQCESPKGCLEDVFSAGSRLSVVLLGCGLKNNCKEDLYQPLLGTSGSQWTDELTQDSCSFCDDHDGCNDGTRGKELKGTCGLNSATYGVSYNHYIRLTLYRNTYSCGHDALVIKVAISVI